MRFAGGAGGFGRLAVFGDDNAMVIYGETARAARADWVTANYSKRNYAALVHVGDLVQTWSTDSEVTTMRTDYAAVKAALPVIPAVGNHDIATDHDYFFEQLWSLSSPGHEWPTHAEILALHPTFKRSYWEELISPAQSSLQDAYHEVALAGRTWGVISLSYWPGIHGNYTASQVVWAKSVADANPGRLIILVTHAYMYGDGTRYDWASKGAGQPYNPHSVVDPDDATRMDGEQLWQALVKVCPNIRVVLSGHAPNNDCYLLSTNDAGKKVHQFGISHMEIASQTWFGGSCVMPNGTFVELEFDTPNNTLGVRTVAPTANQETVSGGLTRIIYDAF